MRRVLVTGATGFLGGAIARRCAALGDDVVGTGRNAEAGARLAAAGVRFLSLPLEDGAGLDEACRGRDLVVHSAALASPFGPEEDFVRANVDGTRHVAEAVHKCGARLVHISTPSIYHTGRDRFLVREDAELLPRERMSSYARTKLAAEDLVRDAARRGLSAVMIRPRGLFGPGDTTLMPRLVRALELGRLPQIGRSDVVGDLTYIDNVVDAVLLAADAPVASAAAYNISNGEPVRLWDLVRRLAEALGHAPPRFRVPKPVALAAARALEAGFRRFRPGKEPPLTVYGVHAVSTSMTLDLSAARRDLGYVPIVSVEEGVRRYLATMGAS